MTLDTDHARLAPCVPRLSGYLRSLLDRAGKRAVELYSDEVGPEHVLERLVRGAGGPLRGEARAGHRGWTARRPHRLEDDAFPGAGRTTALARGPSF